MSITPLLWIEVLALLALANGAPVLVTRVLGDRWSWPLDGGLMLPDGRPLLGRSKTVRGLVASVVAVTLAAQAFGYPGWLGVVFAVSSMAGDAGSSFVKRRLGVEPSGQAMGLDQIPEALLPLLVCHGPLGLDAAGVVLVVALFTLGQVLISPLMYRLGIRHRPY